MEKYPGGGRHKPLLAAHERPHSGKAAVDVAARSLAPKPYPLLAAARQRSRFAAETATVNRERWKSIREEVGTSRSSPLARARAARWRRSTSQRPPALHRKSKCVRQGSRRCQWWACSSSTTLPSRTARPTSTSRWRTPDGRNWPKLVAERSAQRSREEDDAPPAPPPRTRSAPGSWRSSGLLPLHLHRRRSRGEANTSTDYPPSATAPCWHAFGGGRVFGRRCATRPRQRRTHRRRHRPASTRA